jgi:hypothetical protein
MLGRWYGGRGGHDCCRALGESGPDGASNLVDFAALSRVPWKTQGGGHHMYERRPPKDEGARVRGCSTGSHAACRNLDRGQRPASSPGCSGALFTGRGIYTDVDRRDT